MSEQSDSMVLGVLEFSEAKRIQALLEERGVVVQLRNNPETCGSGKCAPKLEVHVLQSDLEKIQAFMQEERIRSLDGLEYDHALEAEVFDPEKEQAKCPACGFEFSTQLRECPDCGLMFHLGAQDEE